MSGPFTVDAAAALGVLMATWESAGSDQIWFAGGTGWCAHHRDAPDTDAIEADTPGELDVLIRADWLARAGRT